MAAENPMLRFHDARPERPVTERCHFPIDQPHDCELRECRAEKLRIPANVVDRMFVKAIRDATSNPRAVRGGMGLVAADHSTVTVKSNAVIRAHVGVQVVIVGAKKVLGS
jgi:hypothetical protein